MSDKYTVARMTVNNEHFEILCKPEKALQYRLGKIAGVREVLAGEIVFSDANKGTKPPQESIHKASPPRPPSPPRPHASKTPWNKSATQSTHSNPWKNKQKT